MEDVQIQNVVATATLHQSLDLVSIMKVFLNVDYNPKRFPGLIYRLTEPKVVMLVFNSGKVVITGARSGEEAQEAAEKLRASLKGNDLILGVCENG
jgi:transcription initiation factor TFIID TATA-box-binding protein